MRKAPFLTDDRGVRSDAGDETAEDANLKYESDEAHCSVLLLALLLRVLLAFGGEGWMELSAR